MPAHYLHYSDARNIAQDNPNARGHSNQLWTPPSPVLTVHEPVLVELKQRQYGHIVHGHTVEFKTPDGRGIDLHQAFYGEFTELDDKDQPAFPPHMDVKAKASIRIQISGIKDYTRQVMSLRSNRDATSISKGKLARTIAKEMKKMMNGDVLHVPGFGDYRMEDIYLTKLGVHLALQMASTCGCPVVASAKALDGRLTSKEEYESDTDNGPAVLFKDNATCWPCSNLTSPFGSGGQKYGVRDGNRWGVGRPSMQRIELSCIPSVPSIYAISFKGTVFASYVKDETPTSMAHKHLSASLSQQVGTHVSSTSREHLASACHDIEIRKHRCRIRCSCGS